MLDARFGEVTDINLKDDDINKIYEITVKLTSFGSGNNAGDTITARPININNKQIPVKGELVLVVRAPAPENSGNLNYNEFYYLTILNIQNSINHNALFEAAMIKKSGGGNYANASMGAPVATSTKKELGKNFKEQNIANLQLFEGDSAFEGRFGQSIRFGSTQVTSNYSQSPTWEKTSDSPNGSPITIIRNTIIKKKSGKFAMEDINKDDSSMYLTSGQKISLTLASSKFSSFDSPPTSTLNFTKNQVLISADRVVINSKTDNVILSAKKSVSLTSDGTMNIDSKDKFVADSPKIYLGGKSATEPLLFGNKTGDWLSDLMTMLQKLITDYTTHFHATGVGPSGPPLPPSLTTWLGEIPTVIQLNAKIPTLKSQRNFTL